MVNVVAGRESTSSAGRGNGKAVLWWLVAGRHTAMDARGQD